MANLKETCISLLSSTATVDMKTAGKTTLYTVPAGKTAIITQVVVRTPSATLVGGEDYDLGTGDNCDTWVQTNDLSSMTTASTDYMVIDGDNTKYTVAAASATFGIKVITGATNAATCTIDIFGIIY